MLYIGRHYSPGGKQLKKAVDLAITEGASAIQTFASGRINRNISYPIQEDRDYVSQKIQENNIYGVVHAAYVINLVQPQTNPLTLISTNYLKEALKWCESTYFKSLVFHPSSAKEYSVEEALEYCIVNLYEVLSNSSSKVNLLLENSAGDKNNKLIGSDIKQLNYIIEKLLDKGIEQDKIGICIDSTHAWAAGYSIEDIIKIAENPFIRLLHLNSPKPEVENGSKKDRHGSFWNGKFSETDIINIASAFKNNPIIMESNPQSVKEINFLKVNLK